MSIIFQVSTPGEAKYRAAVLNTEGGADLVVYMVRSRGRAKNNEAVWYVTENGNEPATKVYFGKAGFSDFKVYFTKHMGRAGWKTDHPLKGRL
ncbi:MAG: DUF6150 family protein [Desulfobacterales bacterium]|nr:DUF6150 family protein [Desulfobacterales bacterium]